MKYFRYVFEDIARNQQLFCKGEIDFDVDQLSEVNEAISEGNFAGLANIIAVEGVKTTTLQDPEEPQTLTTYLEITMVLGINEDTTHEAVLPRVTFQVPEYRVPNVMKACRQIRQMIEDKGIEFADEWHTTTVERLNDYEPAIAASSPRF